MPVRFANCHGGSIRIVPNLLECLSTDSGVIVILLLYRESGIDRSGTGIVFLLGDPQCEDGTAAGCPIVHLWNEL